MKYDNISDDEHDDKIAQRMLYREQEHHDYEIDRSNLQTILDSLADVGEWPDLLKKYKEVFGEPLAKALQGADYELVTRLQWRDRVRVLLQTTITEQTKTEHYHAALKAQLSDSARATAAMARVKAKE